MSFTISRSSITGIGLPLGESLELVTPQFLVYECGYSAGIEDWNFTPKKTPFWCFWHILNEDEENWISGTDKRWKVGPDRILMAPAQVVYGSHNVHPVPQIWLHFSPIPGYAFEASSLFEIQVDTLLREQIRSLIDDYDAAKKGDSRILYHHTLALLNNCFARHPLPLRVLSDELRSVLHQIESDPAGDLSNTRLARSVGMSMCTFISWFESHMNQPPGSYVRQVRYQKASRMLILSDASIEQIAAALGYPNRHYFSRAFALQAGCGPATFRKQHRKPAKT